MSFCKLLGAIILLVGVTACGGPLPVFAPAGFDRPINALELTAAAGVRVERPTGLPMTQALALAEEMAEGLRARGITAAVGVGNKRSRVLQGQASLTAQAAQEGVEDGRILDLIWTLTDPTGAVVHQTEDAWTIPTTEWEADAERVLSRLAVASVTPFADALMGPPSKGPRVVFLGTVAGPPEEGSQALMLALRRGLLSNGIKIAPDLAAATAEITAKLEQKPIDSEREQIRLEWILAVPQGPEIGRLSQETLVQPGVLEANWAESAYFITQGVLPDLLQLLSRSSSSAVYTRPGG